MTADQGTNRYFLYKKRRSKPVSNSREGTGTNNYTPMYVTEHTKLAGQIRDNNTPLYHMMNTGGLINNKRSGGTCGCKGGSIAGSLGILYK